MVEIFRLADIGEGLTEAEIIEWHVEVGDRVAVDDALADIETDKSQVELPSPFAGTVLHRGADQGEVLKVGDIVAVVGAPGETWPTAAEPAESQPPARGEALPVVGSLSEDAVVLAPVAPPEQEVAQRIRALPPVRQLAKSLGVGLASVRPTGSGGTITRADVLAAQESTVERRPAGQATDERRPLSRLRRTIAANLSAAWSQIPIVTAFDEVDAGRLLSARRAVSERFDMSVPLDALLIAALVPALRAYPEFNSSLDEDELVLHGRHDIGLAVDAPDGLMVSVLRDAGGKDLPDLAKEVSRLGKGARERALPADELSGQTFTLSNIGAVGRGGHGTPLVPLGTTALLSVGRVAAQPIVRNMAVEVGQVMPLSLSYDHRVVDGGLGRRFLGMVAEHLEEPALFLA